jgi:hypothetical protein
MKIFSAASAVALVLGISAFLPPTIAHAALPPGYCQNLYAACQQGDQRACELYASVCTAVKPTSTASGMPATKNRSDSSAALELTRLR